MVKGIVRVYILSHLPIPSGVVISATTLVGCDYKTIFERYTKIVCFRMIMVINISTIFAFGCLPRVKCFLWTMVV